MPRGPKGEKRPADAIGSAIMVARISIGEIEDPKGKAPNRDKGGRAGGAARAKSLKRDDFRLIRFGIPESGLF